MLSVELVDINPDAQIEGLNSLAGKVNYFIGRDPANWRTNVPTYAKVRYRSIYLGIDLVYYGRDQRQLEYDFIVAPGADPASIRLRFQGAEHLTLDSAGDLHAKFVEGGEVVHHAPVIYQ